MKRAKLDGGGAQVKKMAAATRSPNCETSHVENLSNDEGNKLGSTRAQMALPSNFLRRSSSSRVSTNKQQKPGNFFLPPLIESENWDFSLFRSLVPRLVS